eukprot:TRINITY_DN21776_c0_g2_i3.p1 TRINITY_DN21776_c0_g2~~TRINITY_DN21776_c0_g2_i3.p1  ORF type:complete len:122 (+),score=6.95 TRINITY_DN21776_c0_g2_i3:776-1141(+)
MHKSPRSLGAAMHACSSKRANSLMSHAASYLIHHAVVLYFSILDIDLSCASCMVSWRELEQVTDDFLVRSLIRCANQDITGCCSCECSCITVNDMVGAEAGQGSYLMHPRIPTIKSCFSYT